MKRSLKVILFTLFLLITLPVHAEVLSNSGFIPGQIWYSEQSLTEGETVNIHTAVWNSEEESLSVKVDFYDKNVILGSRDITLASLELKDVFVPWKVTSGDHVISAKITSSTLITDGKKEKIVLERVATSNDKKFVSVALKNDQGEIKVGTDSSKDQVDKINSKMDDIIPEKVSSSFSGVLAVVDDFRVDTFSKVTDIKYETQKELSLIEKKESEKTPAQTLDERQNIEDATKKPIAYIKLFLFSTLYFIFGNKIIFYGILVLVAFFILRSIYRKIRNR